MSQHVRRLAQLTHVLKRQPTSLVFGKQLYRYMSSNPSDYEHEFFWLKKTTHHEYAFGIKQAFIEEHGDPEIILFDAELHDILNKGDEFATVENTKSVEVMEAPFDNCILYDFNEELDLQVVSEDPENIENRICLFRENSEENSEEDSNYNIPLL